MTLARLGLVAAAFLAPSDVVRGLDSGSTPDITFAEQLELRPASHRIEVDGKLEEAAWAEAAVLELPFEIHPGDNAAAGVETRCRFTFDESSLFFSCQADDPSPDEIRGFIADRDQTEDHDRIVVTIDTFNDARRAFEFGVSALGVQSDALIDEASLGEGGGRSRDASWDAIWASAGSITDRGYVIEAAIPFKSLRFPKTEHAQSWAVSATRFQPRGRDFQYRSLALDRSDACSLCQMNRVVGLVGIRPSRNVQLAPSLTASRSDERLALPAGELVHGSPDAQLGLTALWGPTSDLTVSATLNPDFSQVEADAPQLAVNRRFELLFPERRPFFLEGAELFSTPFELLFTRTLVDPSFGSKLTGKLGHNAFGAMVGRDERPSLVLPGDDGSSTIELDHPVTTYIGRYRRDIGRSATLGVMGLGREGGAGYFNRLVGADVFLRPLPSVSVAGQAVLSSTKDPTVAKADSDSAWLVKAAHQTRKWSNSFQYSRLGADFRADAGFITRTGISDVRWQVDHRFWDKPFPALTWLSLSTGGELKERIGGPVLDRTLWAQVWLTGPLQSDFWVAPFRVRTRIGEQDFDYGGIWNGGSVTPSKSVALSYFLKLGESVNFDLATKARETEIRPRATLRLGRHVDLGFDVSRKRQTLENQTLFSAWTSQLRAVYNFSNRSFFRAILQWSRTELNPELYPPTSFPEETSLAAQLLFSYKLNPESVLFIGYGDNATGREEIVGSRFSLTRTDRTFFMKVSYALRP